MTPNDYNGLVSRLYQAATAALPWHTVLQELAEHFEARFCQLVALHRPTGRMTLSLQSAGAPMDGVLDYMREYHRLDPHVAHGATLPVGTVFNTGQLIAQEVAQAHPFYRDFWQVYGVRYMSAGKVLENDDLTVYLGVMRSAAQGPLQTHADTLLEGLFVHLREAFAIHLRFSRLTAQAITGRLVIDQADRPIALLDPHRFVLHANAAANALLGKGNVLVSRAGYLGCPDPGAEDTLARALHTLELGAAAATGHNPCTQRKVFALRSLQGTLVPACLWALRPAHTMGAFGDTPRAMLMLPTAIGAATPDPVLLAAGFDLTPAESRVLACLAQALDIKETAQRLGISFHTARSHLRSIFDKTGLRTQKELLHQAHQLMAVR